MSKKMNPKDAKVDTSCLFRVLSVVSTVRRWYCVVAGLTRNLVQTRRSWNKFRMTLWWHFTVDLTLLSCQGWNNGIIPLSVILSAVEGSGVIALSVILSAVEGSEILRFRGVYPERSRTGFTQNDKRQFILDTTPLRGLLKTLPVMLNLFQHPLFIRGLRIMSAMTIVLKV